MKKLICCVIWIWGAIGMGNYLWGQVDSLEVDTDTTAQVIEEAMQRNNANDTMALPPSFLKIANEEPKDPLLQRIEKEIRKYEPQVYEKEGKLRLKLSFPWRDPLDLPYVKGLTKAKSKPPYDPAMAWQRSLMFPGWGQVYNDSYGRLLIFYPGYALAAYWLSLTNRQYQDYRTAYTCSINNLTSTTCTEVTVELGVENFDSNGIRTQRNAWRNRREQAYLILAGWHVIQIAEAYVNAHLKDFDVSEDLGFNIESGPSVVPTMGFASSAVPGWGVTLRF
ncbi:MAG: DUF5683 domain-containing protein [Bacteroidota bacterium]